MTGRYVLALGLLAMGSTATAQTDFEKMLSNVRTFNINGTCNRLVTPEGDQTQICDAQLLNMAFPSGNSSFIATMKDKGGISFRGRDSAAAGDIATIKLDTIILTGKDLSSPPVTIKAKGECTYTNPNKGPIHVDCSADTARGKYELSFVSDGVWPPK